MHLLELTMKGRKVVAGHGIGEAMVSRQRISFFGGVNPETGVVIEPGHDLEGRSMRGKVLVFPGGKGSTVGSYVIYGLRKYDAAPVAIVNVETEPIIIGGCVLAKIPLVDKLDKNPISFIETGDHVDVYGDLGRVFVKRGHGRD
jgi:predicted aconitase with swiveling domain